jgi:hypothetical protein
MIQLLLGLVLSAQLPPSSSADPHAEPVLVSQAPAAERSSDAPKAIESTPAPQTPVYRAPRTGQPRGRMSGITRTVGEQLARPLALAPEHVAETIRARPRLYWAIDRAHDGPVIFTLSSRAATEPECEIPLASPARPGAQAVDLAACPLDLAVGTEYEWFVALVGDPGRRSRDHIAQGWIRRVAPPADLELERASAADLAGRGLWYDALQRAALQGDRTTWKALMSELSISSVDLP